MHKLMCTFMTPMKKKIPDRNLDTSCPAGIPCNKFPKRYVQICSMAVVRRWCVESSDRKRAWTTTMASLF